ncbi:MAG: aldose 1-epimerase family protein [Hyphomicrobiales bacterium]|nr:aldose 1-epimerase family protein [Hyphomicrobiales bacterium]
MLTLERDGAKLAVARLGAEARAWSVGGRDLLWPSDPAIWGQISPILYPVVGWTRDGARVNGRHYPLGLHGFAAAQDFTIEAAGADFARLTLADSPATRALYPFAFRLTVEYRLSADALAIALEVENPGPEPAPYACGLHPGFRWPFGGGPREGARVRFEESEQAQIPVMVPGGLVGAAKRTIPLEGSDLPLGDELFAQDALCFLNPASRSLRFEEAGGAAIEMDFRGFDHAALWTRPHAPFLCLEAWTGHSDPEGFAGDLFEKPSMRVLEPGQSARHEARYRFFEGRSDP